MFFSRRTVWVGVVLKNSCWLWLTFWQPMWKSSSESRTVVGCDWRGSHLQNQGLLLVVTDLSTTCVEVIFKIKDCCWMWLTWRSSSESRTVVGCDWRGGHLRNQGLLLVVTDLSTTCVEVIFKIKDCCWMWLTFWQTVWMSSPELQDYTNLDDQPTTNKLWTILPSCNWESTVTFGNPEHLSVLFFSTVVLLHHSKISYSSQHQYWSRCANQRKSLQEAYWWLSQLMEVVRQWQWVWQVPSQRTRYLPVSSWGKPLWKAFVEHWKLDWTPIPSVFRLFWHQCLTDCMSQRVATMGHQHWYQPMLSLCLVMWRLCCTLCLIL